MDPFKVMKKSTGQKWVSCERAGEEHCLGSFSDFENYNAIAYFYLEDNEFPSSRAMLRHCINDKEQPDVGIEGILPVDGLVTLRTQQGQKKDTEGIYRIYGDEKTAKAGIKFLRDILQSKGLFKFDYCITPYTFDGWSDAMLYRNENIARGKTNNTQIIYGLADNRVFNKKARDGAHREVQGLRGIRTLWRGSIQQLLRED
jgi:hypothetical protein